MRYSKLQFVVFAGAFIALTIIFTHIFAVQATFIRIGFGFIPVAIFAAIFGPWRGGCMAAVADFIGCLLFTPGLYFPGFTISAFCGGYVYGHFFHQKQITVPRILIALSIIIVFIDLCLNTLWLSILYQKAAGAFLAARFIKCAALLPVQAALLYAVYKPLRYYHLLSPIAKN